MALRKLTDTEAARVGVVVASLLEAAAAAGWASVSNVDAGEATQILVFTIPITLAAGEWIRRKVFSKASVDSVRTVSGREAP